MNNWYNNKWFVRGVSLALAILLYVFVSFENTEFNPRIPSNGTNEMETLENVPVDIRIDGERFVVSGVPEYATVTLEGPNSILTPTIKQRNFLVYVDLEDLEEGTHMVELLYSNLSNDLSIYIEPKEIEVTIEERASREFPVTVDFINMDELPEGYELGETVINPETITITSSPRIIDQIAMVKVFIDVAGLTESINNREVPINVYDSQGNGLNIRVEPESVVVSVNIDNPSKSFSINVQTSGNLPNGYTLTSMSPSVETVEVFAITDTLNKIETISTEEIDLANIEESGTVSANLILPDGAQVGESKIDIAVELGLTKTIENVPIDVTNQADGQDILFIEPDELAMSVTIIGKDKDINKITTEDFDISIDVGGLSEGEHKVPVKIEGPDHVEFTNEFKEVTIEIS